MKGILIVCLTGLIVLSGCRIFDKPLPEGTDYDKTEQLAQKMLKAVNKEAWDNIRYVQWTFRGKHDYLWDKHNHLVRVQWDDVKVYFNTKTSKGVAFSEDIKVTGQDNQELINQAIAYFNNDSFWLCAPMKIYDSGTERSHVTTEDGKEALKVTYTSGGTTPGDSYLWYLNEEGLPIKWQMWVSIIPIGGVSLTWENWKVLGGGAKIAQDHRGSVTNVAISNLKSGQRLSILGIPETEFSVIEDL